MNSTTGNLEKVGEKPLKSWRRQYWLFAAIPALGLYAFEALKVSSFDTVRAPNTGLITQLLLMFGFFALWTLVPRVIWDVRHRASGVSWLNGTDRMIGALAVAGVALSAAHLMILAVILRVLHSPPGWNAVHLMVSFGEVWVGYAGFWFILYALACLVIFGLTRKEPEAWPMRIEVRQNGKAYSIALSEIYWVEASKNYVVFHTARGGYTLRKSLSDIAGELGPQFLQSHRSALVNAAFVRAVEAVNAGDAYRVMLSSGASAPLSRRRLKAFKSLVKQQPVA